MQSVILGINHIASVVYDQISRRLYSLGADCGPVGILCHVPVGASLSCGDIKAAPVQLQLPAGTDAVAGGIDGKGPAGNIYIALILTVVVRMNAVLARDDIDGSPCNAHAVFAGQPVLLRGYRKIPVHYFQVILGHDAVPCLCRDLQASRAVDRQIALRKYHRIDIVVVQYGIAAAVCQHVDRPLGKRYKHLIRRPDIDCRVIAVGYGDAL